LQAFYIFAYNIYMTKRNLIEIAYTYAKANVGKGEFSFKDA
jgi:hypothetical protein